jgi:hypothetical protein
MSDPTRLLDDEKVASATADLLRALEPPQPAPPAVHQALAEQLSGLVAQGVAPAAGAVWLKAALVSVALAGSGAAAWKLTAAPGVPTQAAISSAAPLRAAPPPPPPLPEASPEPTPEIPAPTTPEPARATTLPSAPAEPRDKLAEEEALLEQARTLVGSSPARALSLLRNHQARFPGGQLAAERMYLSVDCLRRLGRRVEAQREVDALIARFPRSAYARRAPLLLDGPKR